MYSVNFEQQSNTANWFEQWNLLAADDGTPLSSSEVIVTFQMWARSSRGSGDQSQFVGNWPFLSAGGAGLIPAITAATNDGTGAFTLLNGILTLNIAQSILQRLLPGYYEVAMIIQLYDLSMTQQLVVGTLPLYNGGVWPSSMY